MLKSLLLSPTTKRHIERRILITDAMHLYRIIKDVDRYQEFIPLCSHSKVLRRSDDGRYFDATLTVGYPPLFTESYISRVHADLENLAVTAESIKSNHIDSLKSKFALKNVSSLDEKRVQVDFQVEITVSDPIIAQALDQFLEDVAGRQVEAFDKRCSEIPMETSGDDTT